MIHEIPIFSLPLEWLWCETWCSDEGLKKAKTIDLVLMDNNDLVQQPFDEGTEVGKGKKDFT